MGLSFAGVNFDVKAIGGVAAQYVPEELKKAIEDKPILPPGNLPTEGWEIVDIVESQPAMAEEEATSSKGKFRIRVAADPVMVSRNINYKTPSANLLGFVGYATT